MKLDSVFGKVFRLKVCALLGASTLFAVNTGCDPNVQNTFAKSFGDAAVATLEALFTVSTDTVQPGVGVVPTVMLDTPKDVMPA